MADGIDPRKEALKEGLRQLRFHELCRLIDHLEVGGEILLDRDWRGQANHSNGMYCPLAIAVMPQMKHHSSVEGDYVLDDENVAYFLAEECGFKIYNTRGIAGEFYTTNRREDLLTAAQEVLEEKQKRL